MIKAKLNPLITIFLETATFNVNRHAPHASHGEDSVSEHAGYPATTCFVPWAAHIQVKEKSLTDFRYPVEQKALFDLLMEQSTRNPDETDLKKEIKRMLKAPRFDIRSPK